MQVGTDVRVPHMTVEISAGNQPRGLMTRPAQNQTASGLLHRDGKLFDRPQAGGVERRHVAEPQDDDLGQAAQVIVDDVEFIRCAEEKRSMNPENLHVTGN